MLKVEDLVTLEDFCNYYDMRKDNVKRLKRNDLAKFEGMCINVYIDSVPFNTLVLAIDFVQRMQDELTLVDIANKKLKD